MEKVESHFSPANQSVYQNRQKAKERVDKEMEILRMGPGTSAGF